MSFKYMSGMIRVDTVDKSMQQIFAHISEGQEKIVFKHKSLLIFFNQNKIFCGHFL